MIYSKTCSQSHEREYKLCIDRWFTFFPLFNLNQLYQIKFTLSSNRILLEKQKFFWIKNNFHLLCCDIHRWGLNSYGMWCCVIGCLAFSVLRAQWSFKTVTNTQSLTVSYHRRLVSSAVVLNIRLCTSMDVIFYMLYECKRYK